MILQPSRAVRFLVASFILTSIISTSWAQERNCNSLLNSTLTQQLKPVIESSEVCKDFRKEVRYGFGKTTIGLDKTSAGLQNLAYCFDSNNSYLDMRVRVTCATSSRALVTAEVSEAFNIKAIVRNSDCQITDFHAEPSGDLGAFIARQVGFTDQVRGQAQNALNGQCGR